MGCGGASISNSLLYAKLAEDGIQQIFRQPAQATRKVKERGSGYHDI